MPSFLFTCRNDTLEGMPRERPAPTTQQNKHKARDEQKQSGISSSLRHRRLLRCGSILAPTDSSTMMKEIHSLLLICSILALIQSSSEGRALIENPQDHYCGKTWPHAFETCPLPCPGNTDEECASLGEEYSCFPYTGCRDKVGGGGNNLNGADVEKEEEGDGGAGVQLGEDGQDIALSNQYCGATWYVFMWSNIVYVIGRAALLYTH